MEAKQKSKNLPILRDQEDKTLYKKIYRERSIKFRISPEEQTLLERMMIEDDYINMSECIRTRLFKSGAGRELHRRIRNRSQWDILIAIKNYMKKLDDDYRYIKQVMPKDIKAAIGNQNVKQLIELDRKWLDKLQKSTDETNNFLVAIMFSLGIDLEGPIIKSNADIWDNCQEDLKKARRIWQLNNHQEK